MNYSSNINYIDNLCREYSESTGGCPEVVYLSQDLFEEILLENSFNKELETMHYEDVIDKVASGKLSLTVIVTTGHVSIKRADSLMGCEYIWVGTEHEYRNTIVAEIMEDIFLD